MRLLVVVLFLLSAGLATAQPVTAVHDDLTIEVEGVGRVALLGVEAILEAPCGPNVIRQQLAQLVEGQSVRLEVDELLEKWFANRRAVETVPVIVTVQRQASVEGQGAYYVWQGDTLVNAALLRQGCTRASVHIPRSEMWVGLPVPSRSQDLYAIWRMAQVANSGAYGRR